MRFNLESAAAHCDIPCGIYETASMVNAAETCHRMIELINQLGDIDNPEKLNTFVRCVGVKERHAQIVKDQVYILWSDYFKPQHLEQFPDLHQTLWQAAKQASAVKHHLELDDAKQLQAAVAKVDQLFKASKQ